MTQSSIDFSELADDEQNPSSAVYVMQQTLLSIQKIRNILIAQPDLLGEEYEVLTQELREVEKTLQGALTAYKERAEQEPPSIGRYDVDGENVRPIAQFLDWINIFNHTKK